MNGSLSIPHIALVELQTVSAQQLTVFFLKSAGAMMLLLRSHVLQHRVELAWTHRKGSISTLPEETAIASPKGFDPFGGWLLYPFDHLGLGKRSRQCRDDVNVIGDTAHAQGFAAQIATNRCQISVHAKSYRGIEPRFAILRAKDDMNDDLTERLRHGDNNGLKTLWNESRFQR